MIVLAIVGMFQAVTANPVATDPQLRRDERTIVSPYAIKFPDELWPMASEYMNCLNPREGLRSEGVAGFEVAKRARIKACGATREWAISSAVGVYKPDGKLPGNPKEQIATIFDDLDATELRNAKYVDDQFRVQMGLAPAADQESATKDGDSNDH